MAVIGIPPLRDSRSRRGLTKPQLGFHYVSPGLPAPAGLPWEFARVIKPQRGCVVLTFDHVETHGSDATSSMLGIDAIITYGMTTKSKPQRG